MGKCDEISSCLLKYLFILVNLVFLCSGGVIIALGVFIKSFYYDYHLFVDERYLYMPDILIGAGVVVFFISFLGFCGAFIDSQCMTVTYSTLLVLIFVFELSFGIFGYLMKNQVEESLEKTLNYTIERYNKSLDIRSAWNHIQSEFSCCGINGPSDWAQHNLTIPTSCYYTPKNTTIGVDLNDLNTTGCLRAFGDFVRKHSRSIEITGLVLAAFQLFGIVASCCLIRNNRRGYEVI